MLFKKDARSTTPAPTPAPAPAPTLLDERARDLKILAEAETRLATGRLGARCLLSDGQEFPCIARNITMTQAEIHVAREISRDLTLVLWLDVLGLVHARVHQKVANGYIVRLSVAKERRKEFATRLGDADASTTAPEERVAPRIVPTERKLVVVMPTGHRLEGEIIDLSTSGVAVRIMPKPGIGVQITLGQSSMLATVVRHTQDGFAARFNAPIPEANFTPGIRL
jgi:hypothetical protein